MAVEVETMEVKKTQQLTKPISTQVKEETVKSFRVRDFLGGIKDEFNKISWTSADELRTYTKIVVGATFFLGMGIYVMDIAIQASLYVLESIMRFIA